MQHPNAELDELNARCSAQLSKELAELGLHAWYDGSVSGPVRRGGAFFASYDAFETCFRLFPNSIRYFQASLLGDLISRKQATLLSRSLTTFCGQILSRYEGRFAHELKSSIIDKYIKYEQNAAERTLFEAQHGLFPDALYASIPRMCTPNHFKQGEFARGALNKEQLLLNIKHPLQALISAAELICLGPGFSLNSKTIHTVFEWHFEGSNLPGKRNLSTRQELNAEKIIIPTLSYGLQGMIVAFFCNISAEQKNEIRNIIHQFGQNLADGSALIRQRRLLLNLNDFKSLANFAQDLIGLISPVCHLVLECSGEFVGYDLQSLENCFTGFRQLSRDEAQALTCDDNNQLMHLEFGGRRLHIHIKAIKEFSAIETAFAWLRENVGSAQLVSHSHRSRLTPLSRTELNIIRAALQRQIREGARGAHTACRILYLIDAVYSRYAINELIITNHRSQNFMKKCLNDMNIKGYQICGEALPKFVTSIEKLFPRRFSFEPITTKTVRVCWVPILDKEEDAKHIAANAPIDMEEATF